MAGKKLTVPFSIQKTIIAIIALLNVFASIGFIYLYYFVGFAEGVYFPENDPAEKARYLRDTTTWIILTVAVVSYCLTDLIATIIWLKNDLKGRRVLFVIALVHPIIELIFGLIWGLGVDTFCLSFILVTVIINIFLLLAIKKSGKLSHNGNDPMIPSDS